MTLFLSWWRSESAISAKIKQLIDTDHTHQRYCSETRGWPDFADSRGWSPLDWALRGVLHAQVLPLQGQGVVATITDVAHSTVHSWHLYSRQLESRHSLSLATAVTAATMQVPGYARHSVNTNVIFIIQLRSLLCHINPSCHASVSWFLYVVRNTSPWV